MPAATTRKKAQKPDLRTLGTTGLASWAGRISEDGLDRLQNESGRKIFREMSEQDPIIGGTMLGIEMLARQVPWSIKPADETKQAKKVADHIDECLTDLNPSFSDTITEILSMLVYGWSWMEMTYKRREGLDPEDEIRTSRFDDGKIGWATWGIRAQNSLDRWEFRDTKDGRDTGPVIGMHQWAPPNYDRVLIPRSKSLHFTTRKRRQNPEGASILRNAYSSWYFKNMIQKIEGIGIERDLAGLPVIYAPQEIFGDEASAENKTLLAELQKIVTAIKNDEQAGLVMPMAYDEVVKEPLFKIELLSTGGDRQFDTNSIIGRYDARIAMSMLADFMLLGHEGGGGSYALGTSKQNLFSTALSAFLDIVADEINDRAIPQLVLLNGWPLKTVPTLMHGKIETADLAKLGEFLKQLFAAGMSLFPNPDLEAYVLDIAGLPGRDPGAGALPFPIDPETGLPLQPGEIDPATGLPVPPRLDPTTGLPIAAPPTDPQGKPTGEEAAKPTGQPVKKQGVGGRQKATVTPVNASRPRAKIAASEGKSASKHFIPLANRVSKVSARLASLSGPEDYREFLAATMEAGSFTKLSEDWQKVLLMAEAAE